MASNVWRILPVLPGMDEKRSAPRLVVSVTRASVRKITEQPAEASLADLSIYGCKIESPLDHDAGESVWLRFVGANPIHATIVWNEKGYAGCRFDEPIENSLFRSLTQSMTG
ncbi:PilZ domain-containing protein [Sphingomonas paeninsulae]|jgi:hypothetical protein|uniref:PilZ domain-containing protein n=1 Tax=Sphingomonas paeninsulae TaxID=2319844 RepID=A0A494TJN7_SPHPE|nr:PilZ domain-containing protein [Sphingomonas paeninsulae]AYJ85628.1 PilZ domain-containing protein [Sphingomonas paeninsulae]